MKLGGEPKKVVVLGALVVVGGYVFYSNVFSSTPETPAAPQTKAQPQAASSASAPGAANPNNSAFRKKSSRGSGEFRPSLKFAPNERPNYATIDPTPRLDLLAKVRALEPEGGARSLFQFSAAPPPPPPTTLTKVGPIHPGPRRYGPEPPPPPPGKKPPAPEPPPPPITLKFYGYSAPRADGARRAFFLDGDEIFVAAEGELVKKRYRVVQIGVNSVVMEDTQYKNNRQTIILQQEQAG